jgi:hypothetical protein
MAVLQDLSQATREELLAKIASLQAAKLTMRVTEKGGLSVYGLGQFPVTLYRSQWERLIEAMPSITEFIAVNADQLSERRPPRPTTIG